MNDLQLDGATVLLGDCIARMKELPAGSAQMSVTSPPYYGLRDYGHDGQIGLEETPEAYIAKMVEVFREVRRVLADDGTLWLNIGDSYASAWACSRRNRVGNGSLANGKREHRPNRLTGDLKEKDLIGIPWMLAFALRADGWYLRQEIIWHKSNPAPEGRAAHDRCTKAHEHVFLLTKQFRYHIDMDTIREPSEDGQGRNRRSVWKIPASSYKGAHFATFPPDLVEPFILAGSRPGDVVLDPFNGSGTTGQVAIEHGRRYVGTELNPEYVALTRARLEGVIAAKAASPTPSPQSDLFAAA